MIQKILVDKDGRWYFWRDGDFCTKDGVIKAREIKNKIVKSHLGREFRVFDAQFADSIKKIKRGPAIILPKDIGAIVAYTGLGKDSVALDAGTGCGVLAICLARICKKVISYEIDKRWFKLAKENFRFLNIKNVELKNKDVAVAKEKNLDTLILDLPEPWKCLKCTKCLKSGGFFVCYLPNISQVAKLVKCANKDKELIYERTIELIERKWHIDKRTRPESRMIGHTGFLCFFRKT